MTYEQFIKKVRELDIQPSWFRASIEWVFFENAPMKCKRNVMRRNDGRRVLNFIERESTTYAVPEGYKALPVWQLEPTEPIPLPSRQCVDSMVWSKPSAD